MRVGVGEVTVGRNAHPSVILFIYERTSLRGAGFGVGRWVYVCMCVGLRSYSLSISVTLRIDTSRLA